MQAAKEALDEMEALIDEEIETHHAEKVQIASAFQSMADGKLDPTMAFMQGKIKVNGDMSVAMKLQPIMAKARG